MWSTRSAASMNDVDADEHWQTMAAEERPRRVVAVPGWGLFLVIASVRLCPGQSSMTARDQHQPASSRAIATFAITGSFLRSVKCSHRWCSRWLPACPRARAAAGASSHLAFILAPGVR